MRRRDIRHGLRVVQGPLHGRVTGVVYSEWLRILTRFEVEWDLCPGQPQYFDGRDSFRFAPELEAAPFPGRLPSLPPLNPAAYQ